jgi:hypothetical protein
MSILLGARYYLGRGLETKQIIQVGKKNISIFKLFSLIILLFGTYKRFS